MRIDDRILLNQLTAARASIDTLIMMLMQQADREIEEEPTPAGFEINNHQAQCKHINKQNLQTFGSGIWWICRDCGLEYKEGAEKEEITKEEIEEESSTNEVVQAIREMVIGRKEG